MRPPPHYLTSILQGKFANYARYSVFKDLRPRGRIFRKGGAALKLGGPQRGGPQILAGGPHFVQIRDFMIYLQKIFQNFHITMTSIKEKMM